jgi:hypothetical protein
MENKYHAIFLYRLFLKFLIIMRFFISDKPGRHCFRIKIKKKIHLLTPSHSVPCISPESTFKYLVCTQGFGHSGSGVLLDLFSEFKNITVLGSHDKNGGSALANKKTAGEFDFVRRYGGVYFLENAFKTREFNQRDFMLKSFITLSEYFYLQGGVYTDEYMRLTKKFISDLVKFKITTPSGLEGNAAFKFKEWQHKDYPNLQTPFSYANIKDRYLYYLKDLSVAEYREIAKGYILSVLKTIESKEYLVLDQFCGDGSTDMERKQAYAGPFKKICVYRDPRDVYATGYILEEHWIPKDPNDFIDWYRYAHEGFIRDHDSPDIVTVRFEDLVLQYSITVTKVLHFLDIDKDKHIHPKKYFNPEISKKNIGLWKSFPDQDSIDLIYRELRDFCYDN